MNRIIAILVLSLFSFTVAFSFHPNSKHGERNKKKCKEHRITPEKAEQLNKLKNEFDQQLEPTDLELLNDLRDKTYIQKDKMKSQIMEIKNSTDDKNERKTKIKELFESEKEEKVKIKTELDNLLNKYPDEVAELKLKLKPFNLHFL